MNAPALAWHTGRLCRKPCAKHCMRPRKHAKTCLPPNHAQALRSLYGMSQRWRVQKQFAKWAQHDPQTQPHRKLCRVNRPALDGSHRHSATSRREMQLADALRCRHHWRGHSKQQAGLCRLGASGTCALGHAGCLPPSRNWHWLQAGIARWKDAVRQTI